MSIGIVLQQMIVIFILMAIGYVLTKREMLGITTSQQLSAIIVNICNPAVVFASAFDDESVASNQSMLVMTIVVIVSYAGLVLLGNIMGYFMHAPKEEHKFYNLMTVFGNTGFIGIPVVSAVLGQGAVIYVAVFNVAYNILIYTYGITVLSKGEKNMHTGSLLRKIFSWGTLSGILALLIFMLKIPMPSFVKDSFTYMGRATTFLSMIVLGASLARMKLADVFLEKRLYPFVVLRMVGVPIVTALILKQFISDPLIIGVAVLLIAMPVGNMPLMLANQYKLKTDILAKGIVLTTILSLFTITITALFL